MSCETTLRCPERQGACREPDAEVACNLYCLVASKGRFEKLPRIINRMKGFHPILLFFLLAVEPLCAQETAPRGKYPGLNQDEAHLEVNDLVIALDVKTGKTLLF